MQHHRDATPSDRHHSQHAHRTHGNTLPPRVQSKRASALRMSCSPPTTIALFQDPMSDDDEDDDQHENKEKHQPIQAKAIPEQGRNHSHGSQSISAAEDNAFGGSRPVGHRNRDQITPGAPNDFVTPKIRPTCSSALRMSCSPPTTIALFQDPMSDDDMEDESQMEDIDQPVHPSPDPGFTPPKHNGTEATSQDRSTTKSPIAHRTSTPPRLRPRRSSVTRMSYSPPTAIALFQEPMSDHDDNDDNDERMDEVEPEAEHATNVLSGFGGKRRFRNNRSGEQLNIVTESASGSTPWKPRFPHRKGSSLDLPEDNRIDMTPRIASSFPDFFSPVMPSCSPSQTPRKISRCSRDNSEVDISSCSTLSMSSMAWSPSTPAKPMPPTPLRNNWLPSGTPSRYDALVRKEVLVNLMDSDTTQSSLNDIEVVQLIGAGISGYVYKARSSHDGNLYAVKKSRHQLRSERERQLLLQEITIFQHLLDKKISFDHIVRHYQAWQEDGYLYLQTELCAGGNLTGFLNSYPAQILPESSLWSILHDVAKGLEVLHRHGIVHLDVKPDNIFITEEGRLKLGDFGLASLAGPRPSSSNDSEGDTAYMAKELLNSEERYPSADVFCLGVTMLEIAASITLPASGEQWHLLRQGHLPGIHPNYSQDLELVIRQMMHPDPSSRPTSTDVVQHPRVKACADVASPIIAEYVFHQKAIEKQLECPHTSQSVTRTPRKPIVSLPWD